jgi:phospholipase C
MGRTALLWLLLLFAGAVLLSMNSCGGNNSATQGKIKHVVIIFQENRTPDNLFHGLPNADIANTGVNSLGHTITLAPIALANHYDLGHRHNDFVLMYDNGKMDGADKITACTPGTSGCPPNPQFQYVKPSDVAPYFQLAQQYTFGDRMFQTNEGPSFPAHQFITFGHVRADGDQQSVCSREYQPGCWLRCPLHCVGLACRSYRQRIVNYVSLL